MKFEVTINRRSDDTISIAIGDVLSGIEFVDVQMTPEDFANCITGLSGQAASGKVRGLEFVGKTRVTERRRKECSLSGYDKAELRKWLEDNAQEDGWILNTYLGSQSSVSYKDGKTILNYSVTKYVTKEPDMAGLNKDVK